MQSLLLVLAALACPIGMGLMMLLSRGKRASGGNALRRDLQHSDAQQADQAHPVEQHRG